MQETRADGKEWKTWHETSILTFVGRIFLVKKVLNKKIDQ